MNAKKREKTKKAKGTITKSPVWIKTGEIAEVLGRSSENVRQLLERGTLPGVRIGSHWQVRRDDLTQWLTERGW